MIDRKFYRILALVLAVSMAGTIASPAFGDCNSPCCGRTAGCQPLRAIPEACTGVHLFPKEIRGASCEMSKIQNLEAAVGAGLTAPRMEPSVEGLFVVCYDGGGSFSNPPEAQPPRSSAIPRAAPVPLYIHNLTLLI